VETIKHRVEDVLSCADQKTQDLLKQMVEKINESQVDLQAIRTSVDTREKSLFETITDTREHLHEELGLTIQGEAQRGED
jgi:RNase adaptor protein for sRNA GlmZ degradation